METDVKNETIRILITDDGMFSKWVGAELVSAIDSHNMRVVGYILRARNTLTCTTMLGRQDHPEDKIEIWVEALSNEEGRAPVAVFEMSRELYGDHEKHKTDHDTLHWLADVIQEHYCDIKLQTDDEEQEEVISSAMTVKPIDKNSN